MFSIATAAVEGRPHSDKASALDHFIRGSVADVMEDRYRALYHYQEALRYDSTSAFIYVALAQDYILLGNPSQALMLLDKALQIQSDHIPALELKALLLRTMGKGSEARNVLRRLVEIVPDKSDYQRQLLAVELAMGNYREADRIFQRIEQDGYNDGFLSRQVLAVYLTVGEYDRAEAILRALIEADSTDAGLYYTLGNCRLQQRDTVQAEYLLNRANRMEPGEPRYWIALAAISMSKQQYSAVTELIDSALVHTEPHTSLYNLKGLALYRAGEIDESIIALRKAIELDSTMYVAIGSLALVYDEVDSLSEAVELYERAIRLSDSAATYLNNLAYTLASRGLELERAKTLSNRALELEPENGAYLDTMGWIEFGLGNYQSALRWLKKALRADPGNAATLEHLGDTYTKLGDRANAKKYYKDALEKNPGNEQLIEKLNP